VLHRVHSAETNSQAHEIHTLGQILSQNERQKKYICS